MKRSNSVCQAASLISLVLAQVMSAQQVSELNLTPLGVASLNNRASAAAAIPTPAVEPVGRVIPKRSKPRLPGFAAALAPALKIPNPAGLSVIGPDYDLSGFPALNVLGDPALNSGFLSEPPDQALAVGNGFVLEAVNLELAIFDAGSGRRLTSPVGLNAFFGVAPLLKDKAFGPFLSDPKCYFDHDTQHWFITVLELDTDPVTGNPSGNTNVLIAVSQTALVYGPYNLFALNTTDDGTQRTQIHPGCPCLPDQPLIGADRYGFYISTNEFPLFKAGFNGANLYAMSKQNLAMGALTTVVHFSGLPLAEGLAFSVQPATSPSFASEPVTGVEYFLSSLDFNNSLDNRIAVWALTNTRSLSNLHPNVTLLKKVLNSQTYGAPPPAVQRSPL